MTLLLTIGTLVVSSPPAEAATHVPPTMAYAGEDLTLHIFVCLTRCYDNVQLHYIAPWGEEKVMTAEEGFWQSTSFTVPGNDVRAIYASANSLPVFTYWFVVNGSRMPSLSNYTAAVRHRLNLQLMTEDGIKPLSDTRWRLYYLAKVTSLDSLPNYIELVNGRTGTDGRITATIPITAPMLEAATYTNGLVNLGLSATCVKYNPGGQPDNEKQVCVDPESTTRTVGQTEDEVLAVAWDSYMNVAAPAEDAATAGVAIVEQAQQRQVKAKLFKCCNTFDPLDPQFAQCDGDQSCNTGGSPPPPGYCEWTGWGTESWVWNDSHIAELHYDYGTSAEFAYGRKTDSRWTVGFKAGSGNYWSLSGENAAGGETEEVETRGTGNNLSGNMNTRVFMNARMRHALYRYQSQRFRNGDQSQPYCDLSWKVISVDRHPQVAMSPCCADKGSSNKTYKDRCWETCANGAYGYYVPNAPGSPWSRGSRKTKSEFTTAGITIWGFAGGSYSSGSSTSARKTWFAGGHIKPCTAGWTYYFNGTQDFLDSPNAFVDAGNPGAGYQMVNNVAVPDGC